jgi:DNA invertase Pin-like site-specific DNA recombinase
MEGTPCRMSLSSSKRATLLVTKLDRLARRVSDVTKRVEKLEAQGVDLVVLDNSGIDTRTPQGKLIFHILAAVGELERSLINERTAEGREKAMRVGVKFGRKESLTTVSRRRQISKATVKTALTAHSDSERFPRKSFR